VALRRPEPGTFEKLLTEVHVRALDMVRLTRFAATEPYWSKGVHRFDDPEPSRPNGFGCTYAAESLDVAFAESIIHECSRFVLGHYEVPLAELTGRHTVRFHRPRRPTLVLADLRGDALKRLGLNNDLCATDDYTVPQLWAQAIHDADPKWDGIRYVSRQKNDTMAYALFERSRLRMYHSEPFAGSALHDLCDKFMVVAI
jgi:hypothetical protein